MQGGINFTTEEIAVIVAILTPLLTVIGILWRELVKVNKDKDLTSAARVQDAKDFSDKAAVLVEKTVAFGARLNEVLKLNDKRGK